MDAGEDDLYCQYLGKGSLMEGDKVEPEGLPCSVSFT